MNSLKFQEETAKKTKEDVQAWADAYVKLDKTFAGLRDSYTEADWRKLAKLYAINYSKWVDADLRHGSRVWFRKHGKGFGKALLYTGIGSLFLGAGLLGPIIGGIGYALFNGLGSRYEAQDPGYAEVMGRWAYSKAKEAKKKAQAANAAKQLQVLNIGAPAAAAAHGP